MIPDFEIVGKIPLFSPYYDKSERKKLYPLNPAAIPYDDRVIFLVRWVSDGQSSFDPTKKIGVYKSGWDFEEIEFISELEFPKINDVGVVNPIEDVRARIPNENEESYVCFNYLCCRENGEHYPIPAGGILSPPYERLEDVVAYKGQIGKNVLPLNMTRNENGLTERELIFRLDVDPKTNPKIFRYINDKNGQIRWWDEEIESLQYWASEKCGLTGSPIHVFEDYGEAELFVVHGYSAQDGIIKYSLGTAIRKDRIWKLSPDPFQTPEMMRKKLKGLTDFEFRELRPDCKEVIYADAIIPNGDRVYIPANLGDYAVAMIETDIESLFKFSEPLFAAT